MNCASSRVSGLGSGIRDVYLQVFEKDFAMDHVPQITPGLKRAAAMVILRCERQYLLLKRAKAPNMGMYVPVGGKLEPFEDPYSAALRETFEETGIALPGLRYAGSLVETSPTSYNWWCNVYLADIAWQAPPPCDEGELAWIGHEELLSIPTPPTDWHIYQMVLEGRPFALNALFDAGMNLVSMTEEISGEQLITARR